MFDHLLTVLIPQLKLRGSCHQPLSSWTGEWFIDPSLVTSRTKAHTFMWAYSKCAEMGRVKLIWFHDGYVLSSTRGVINSELPVWTDIQTFMQRSKIWSNFFHWDIVTSRILPSKARGTWLVVLSMPYSLWTLTPYLSCHCLAIQILALLPLAIWITKYSTFYESRMLYN